MTHLEGKTAPDFQLAGSDGKVTGTIRSTVVIGPDGTIVKHWHPVKDAAGHPQQVADFLATR